jgi:dUTP pyrophosphatase
MKFEGCPADQLLKGTNNSAGYAIKCTEDGILAPMKRKAFKTGLGLILPNNVEAQVRPRSGLAKDKGITILNAPGTIDPDYRREIKVILINLSESSQE